MKTSILPLFFAAAMAFSAGCARQESAREIDWAKSALARNPAFEIVATDESAGIFTVRDTVTGAVTTLKLEDLIATPRQAAPASTAAPAAPAVQPEKSSDDAAVEEALADHQTTEEATEVVSAVPVATGPTLAEGPGYSIARGEHAPAPPVAQPTLEGPGYSITREEPRRRERPTGDVAATGVEKRTDPIICQGERLMRIDGETLEFTGNALIAEQGCDLYITNANIRAGGLGLIARQARVHIVNSTIRGSLGSYEASEGAQIYVTRSTFSGIGRRFDGASMTDLGGNRYTTQ